MKCPYKNNILVPISNHKAVGGKRVNTMLSKEQLMLRRIPITSTIGRGNKFTTKRHWKPACNENRIKSREMAKLKSEVVKDSTDTQRNPTSKIIKPKGYTKITYTKLGQYAQEKDHRQQLRTCDKGQLKIKGNYEQQPKQFERKQMRTCQQVTVT